MAEVVTALGLLVLPAANRVYALAAPAMAAAELAALDEFCLGGRLGQPSLLELAGVPYVRVAAEDWPDTSASVVLGAHSLAFALFELVDGGATLRPLPLPSPMRLDDDLLTIPRYQGRTNERFTRLLVNLAGAAAAGTAAFDGSRPLRLLDPVCGRGTTLHQAVAYGWSAAGIEHDKRDVEAWNGFFPGWLQDKRIPHTPEKGLPKGRSAITFGLDREAQRAGATQRIEVVCGDTVTAASLFPKASFDCFVGDLPYGVRHGSRAVDKLERGPAALLEAALPGWRSLLRPGGSCVLAWNRKVLPRLEMEALLLAASFEVLSLPGGPDALTHRVDRAVERDAVVARRPAG